MEGGGRSERYAEKQPSNKEPSFVVRFTIARLASSLAAPQGAVHERLEHRTVVLREVGDVARGVRRRGQTAAPGMLKQYLSKRNNVNS